MHHCWKGLKIGSVVPRVQQLLGVYSGTSKQETSSNAEQTGPPSEGLTSVFGGVQVWEIMNELLVRHNWNATLEVLHAATEHRCNRPSQETTNDPVGSKCVLILSLNCALIFPWNSFGASHEFTEAISDPGVTLEIILKEIHVLTFLLLSRHARRFELEDFLDLALLFVVPLVLLRIVIRLSHPEVVCVIVLRRHFVYYYN